MSNVQDVMSIAKELKKSGEALIAMADALSMLEVKSKSEESPTGKQITLEEVRAVLAKKAAEGLSAEVKALLDKYGAKKLSDIKPDNYDQLMKEAEGIGNA